jgi:hypothetical protein
VLCADFEKMMLYHIDRSARQALDLYNNTEGVSRPSRFQDVRKFAITLHAGSACMVVCMFIE